MLPAVEVQVSTTGPPGKSWELNFSPIGGAPEGLVGP